MAESGLFRQRGSVQLTDGGMRYHADTSDTENYGFVQDNVRSVYWKTLTLHCGELAGTSVTLLAVTKFHPQEAVLAAYAAGIRFFEKTVFRKPCRKFGRILQDDYS